MKFCSQPALALAFALVGSPAFAAPVWSAQLTVYQVEGDANMTIYFNEAPPNPANCTQGPLKTASWAATSPAAKNFMSMMLTAKAANRQVQVLVDDSVCLWGGWPSLLSMKLL